MAVFQKLLQNPSIFTDSPLQIIAGENKRIYYAHSTILACNSSALNARINGPWREHGNSEPIDWSDFDEPTVECVLSYVYTSDYYVPGAVYDEQEKYRETGNDIDLDGNFDVSDVESPVPDTELHNKWEPDRPLPPLSRYSRFGLPALTFQTAAGGFSKTTENRPEALGHAILIHSKVYCFAHRFCFTELEEFAIQRLTQVLLACNDLLSELFPHLADSIRLIYGSTPTAVPPENPARRLLSRFVALRYSALSVEVLETVIAEGGDFMIDLSHQLCRRLASSGTDTQIMEEQIDELQARLEVLESEAQRKEIQLERYKEEIEQWESWNRGLSGKYSKAKRKVKQAVIDPNETSL
ncbi:hypothetical protein BO70DRAFT_361456 [Aspergillus heteromorphus CBS 117.55]|uniref:BTB domain-containing protein n=1 Tax=Aspergillus heteromorphus CBS 117.55 TaxID=1448321 RepID=A0A317WC25_9EURO|nr:uncharacterized protein BO70DRAFT_361456 [Aspergillus heteromorphus CBS 117.55]PWY83321.1 hypothetical protein BO70DRAFT_361456 [Aspergillus heteromorphus CBS 117.55]